VSKVSLHAIDQMYSSHSADPMLMLLKITFPNTNTFHYVNNTEDITSNGQLYTAFPFKFTLPSDTDEEVPILQITISNIGLDLIDDLSVSTSDVIADIDIVFASVPDFVEINLSAMILKGIVYDDKFITMSLGYDDILNVQVPSYTYSAKDYPGLLSV